MEKFAFALLIFSSGSALVFAQAPTTINGRVVDPARVVVPKAAITVIDMATGIVREFTTNFDGSYSFSVLTPGKYNAKVNVHGFDAAERADVEPFTRSVFVDFRNQTVDSDRHIDPFEIQTRTQARDEKRGMP